MDRRLLRCVHGRRLPLEAPESDHNLVHAKVRIPRKTMNLEMKQDRSSAYIKCVDGILLKHAEFIREQWVRWFHTLLNVKLPKLDLNIAEWVHQWSENMPLRVQPAMQELTDAIRSLANGKALGPDGLSVELFKVQLSDDPALRWRLLDIVVCIRGGGGA